jgi:hypothetical protein
MAASTKKKEENKDMDAAECQDPKFLNVEKKGTTIRWDLGFTL